MYAILVYSGIITLREHKPFCAALEKEHVEEISGMICSNPSRNYAGTFYTAEFMASSVRAHLSKSVITSGARGTITVRIPSAIVEAVYPGKLYSKSKSGTVLVESGEQLTLRGKWSPYMNAFVAEHVVYEGHSGGFLGRLRHCRALCRLIFKRLLYSWGSAGGLVLSLLSGSREYTDGALGDAFRKAGLSHILALSGMHLSFFSGLTGGAGRRIFGKKYIFLFELAGILFFVWFAGLSPSLLRALLCSLITLCSSVLFCKQIQMVCVLSGSFLIHAVLQPEHLHSVAFMLSYGALLGIVLFEDMLHHALCPVVPSALSSPLCASVGAQAITMPLCAHIFKTIMPIGIVSSVVVSPLISIFLTTALGAIVLSLAVPFCAPLCGIVLNIIYAAIRFLVTLFASAPPLQF